MSSTLTDVERAELEMRRIWQTENGGQIQEAHDFLDALCVPECCHDPQEHICDSVADRVQWMIDGGGKDNWSIYRREIDDLKEALTSVAVARQDADDWDHPDFDWKLLAHRMEHIARRALHLPSGHSANRPPESVQSDLTDTPAIPHTVQRNRTDERRGK